MTSHNTQTPAARLIERFSIQTLARWTRRDRSRVHAWTWPKSRGGTGGVVPHPVRPAIIQGAKDDLNVDLAYADFEPINGEAYLDAAPAREDAQ
ncbi:hypothetical protein [Brevundimonas nasdae]|uniref:Uncharacterized protein n=1 Tax=Brevundimonas nasdae TaxID=172043 RepID=A0ABX8TH76_9CAUL|nr:hypothetical protein [Brevundimonas nasdae]QYC10586.1 hypothetical protein KWG56_00740 [Brevundimonas nasdae]